MTGTVQTHQTNITMAKAVPAELYAGADLPLKVRVSCPSACDLRGNVVKIIAQDDVVKEIELIEFIGAVNETDPFVIQMPVTPGTYSWTAVFPSLEKGDTWHGGSSVPFSFIVKPHATSMAVWDTPSPIVSGSKFMIKVGVKCSAECKLSGASIEVYGQNGMKLTTALLGETPWPQTDGLYWTEVELGALPSEGVSTWTVKFPASELGLPHEGASVSFICRTTRPPEHTMTIEVVDKEKKTPIKNAEVFLNPYRSYTDACGVAKFQVPKGEYEFDVLMDDYEILKTRVDLTGDLTLKVELLVRVKGYWE